MANHRGICSICKSDGHLSEDHIPPKSCGNTGKVYYYSFAPNSHNFYKKRISQNGIKFRTICSQCNSKLGALYDKELTLFRECVINSINGNPTKVEIYPIKVIKCIVGHLLAASSFSEDVISEEMREFYLNNDNSSIKKFASKYSLLCFYYPYKDSIFILKNYFPNEIIGPYRIFNSILSSMYFFPFAFILCEKKKELSTHDILNLIFGEQLDLSVTDWTISNGAELPPTWPAIINDHQFILFSNDLNFSVYKEM